MPQLINKWLTERLQLEKRSLEYRIGKQEAAIAYSKLLIFAASSLDIIFKALRVDDSQGYLVKYMKISPEQATQILELRVRQLSKLDTNALKNKLAEQVKELNVLQGYFKKPRPKIIADCANILAAIERDRKFEASKDRKMSVK